MGCQSVTHSNAIVPQSYGSSQNQFLQAALTNRVLTSNEKINKVDFQITAQDEVMLHQTLSKHSLLYQLSKYERSYLISCFEMYSCQENTTVFSKGNIGNHFFIIRSGTVLVQDITNNPNQKGVVLRRGNYFGQYALLYSSPRSATITTISKCYFYCVGHQAFRQIVQEMVKKQFHSAKNYIDKVPIFKYLTKREKTALAYNTHFLKFNKDTVIFEKGEPANCFYILIEGKVAFIFPDMPILQMKAGSTFGQNSFKPNQLRSGTCRATEKTTLLTLGQSALIKCFGNQLHELLFYNILKWSLSRHHLFKLVTSIQRERLIGLSNFQEYEDGQLINRVGQKAKHIIICLQGKLNNEALGSIFNTEYLTAQNENQLKLSQNIKKNQNGFVALIEFQDIFKVVGKSSFSIVNKKEGLVAELLKIAMQKKQYLENIGLKNFNIWKKLVETDLSKIYMVEDQYHKFYGMKCIKKQTIIKNGMEENLIEEKKILRQLNGGNGFIIKLYKTFKDQYFIYFLLSFVGEVDFYDALKEIGICDRKSAQFYGANIIIALQYLHQHNVIYRNLKPENIGIDQKGFLCLNDLSIAKQLNEDNGYRTFTIIGTPFYMAPQILNLEGYSFPVDLWALGIIMYEMLCGRLPFGHDLSDPFEIFKQIESKQLKFPKFYNDNAGKQLMEKLLSKCASDRFVEDFSKLKTMSFFDDFNWNNLTKRTMKAPYKINNKEKKKRIDENLMKYMKRQKASLRKPQPSLISDWDQSF